MIYYLAWLVLMIVGLTSSLLLFMWAFRAGQFSDQTRARYLPLFGETFEDQERGRGAGRHYGLVVLVLSAASMFGATLVVALMHR